jgi:hypothetical protein
MSDELEYGTRAKFPIAHYDGKRTLWLSGHDDLLDNYQIKNGAVIYMQYDGNARMTIEDGVSIEYSRDMVEDVIEFAKSKGINMTEEEEYDGK